MGEERGGAVMGEERGGAVMGEERGGAVMGERQGRSGMGEVRLVDVRETPLSVDEVLAAVSDARAGGIAIFVGTVRSHDGGRDVDALDYEAHPGAVEVMRSIAESIAQRPEVIALAAVHRVGALAIGDLAVVVAASTAHRHDAFRAGQDLIDAVKENVPIWKRQVFRDGEIEWVGALG